MKQYIIFAGVNGAGKSTLYQTNQELMNMPRINVDEIVKSIGDWHNTTDVIKAGKIAVKKLKDCLDKGISFNQETTLCGKSILKNIKNAKELGYRVELYYVGLDSVETAKQRVRMRVEAGGHGIPDADIERRYHESLNQLKVILPLCDIVEIYDNTTAFTKIASFENGICVAKSDHLPTWLGEQFFP